MRLRVTSICGTDYSQAAGMLGPTRGILGHEGVGVVEQLGAEVAALDPTVRPGQRVGVAWTRDYCGECGYCASGRADGETRCAKKMFSGSRVDGTFAEYTLVPLHYLCRIPPELDAVPDEHVAPLLCGGVTAFKAVKTACDGVPPHQWVAVSGGGGGVGAFAVAFARAMGFRVVAVDAGPEKGAHARASGAEHYVDVTAAGGDVGDAVKRLTDGGHGVAAAIVATGSIAAYDAAWDMLAPFGTVMCVGIPPPGRAVSYQPIAFIASGFRLLGSSVGTRQDILDALDYVRRGLVVPTTHDARLEDMDDLILRVAQGKAGYISPTSHTHTHTLSLQTAP